MARRRNTVSLDYSTFHKTGQKIPISRSTNRNEALTEEDKMTEAAATEARACLLQAEEGCDEAISDFFDENSLAEAYSFEEIDSNVVEIKNLRTEYKRLHRQLKSVIDDYETSMKPKYDEICEKITKYIKDAKAEKNIRSNELHQQATNDRKLATDEQFETEQKAQKERIEQEDRICEIKNKEIEEKINHIKSLYSSVDTLEDDEVLDLKINLTSIDQELRDLRDMRDRFEKLISDYVKKEEIIRNLAAEYKKTNDAAVKYKEDLKAEIKKT